MKPLLALTVLLLTCTATLAQQPVVTWGCRMQPPTDKVSDIITLNCREKDSAVTFILDIPKSAFPAQWGGQGAIGMREFVYGGGKAGERFALRTAATHCDTEYDIGGSRNQEQVCGIMFPRDREVRVLP